jgi:hypothetical protein
MGICCEGSQCQTLRTVMLKKKYEYFIRRSNITYSNFVTFMTSCEENATVRQTILIIFDFAMACKLLRREQESYIWSRF